MSEKYILRFDVIFTIPHIEGLHEISVVTTYIQRLWYDLLIIWAKN